MSSLLARDIFIKRIWANEDVVLQYDGATNDLVGWAW